MIRITTVDPNYVEAVESIILPWLVSACQYTDSIAADELVEASKGILTRILLAHKDDLLVGVFAYEYIPAENVMLQLSTTYNNMSKDEIQELMLQIASMFREAGISAIRGVGRKGWKRVAPKLGWSVNADGSYTYPLQGDHK